MGVWWMVEALAGGLLVALVLRGLMWTADVRGRLHVRPAASSSPAPRVGSTERLLALLARLIGTSRRVHGVVAIAAGCI